MFVLFLWTSLTFGRHWPIASAGAGLVWAAGDHRSGSDWLWQRLRYTHTESRGRPGSEHTSHKPSSFDTGFPKNTPGHRGAELDAIRGSHDLDDHVTQESEATHWPCGCVRVCRAERWWSLCVLSGWCSELLDFQSGYSEEPPRSLRHERRAEPLRSLQVRVWTFILKHRTYLKTTPSAPAYWPASPGYVRTAYSYSGSLGWERLEEVMG